MKIELAHIVLVDDDSDLRTVNGFFVKELGVNQIATVDSVKAMFTYLDLHKDSEPVDLIIMDVMMPDLDGIKGCGLLQEHPAYQDIPVIMLTALDLDQTIEAAFENGAMDFLTKPFKPVELKARIRSALKLKSERDQRKQREHELFQLTQQLISRQEDITRTSFLDELTGIYNRRAFNKALEDEWRYAYLEQRQVSLMMIDIDYFKKYNDTYGHQAGDEALQTVAQFLSAQDATTLVARYGGEEFCLLARGQVSIQEFFQLAEGLCEQLEQIQIPHEASDVSGFLTLSIGCVSLYPSDSLMADLVAQADLALYDAKSSGRNRAKLYQPSISE